VTAGSTGLPGSTAAMQQIVVDSTAGNYNRVTVNVCWKSPADNVTRRHTMTTYVN
jgi:hypothetical protein